MAGTPTQQGTFTFTVTESAQAGSPLQQTYSVAVGPPLPPTDTTENFPPAAGTVGIAYGAGFTVAAARRLTPGRKSRGSSPRTRPDLDRRSGADRQRSGGTPTTAGTYVFTTRVTDTFGDTASAKSASPSAPHRR